MTFTNLSPQRILLSTKPMLIMLVVLIAAPCNAISINCSAPNQLALLEALKPIFKMGAIRPVTNMTTPTNVSLHFLLYGILGVDEKAQLLTTYLWQHFWWQNELVNWDPVQCGTDKISLPRHKFWIPDLVIREFMDQDKAPSVPYVNLHSNGKIHDAKPARVVSSCNLDIYTFPFDRQDCTLTFGSFINLARDLKLSLSMSDNLITAKSKSVMTTLGEWELLNITAVKLTHHYSEDNDVDLLQFHVCLIMLHIRLGRRSTLYVVNLLLPSIFLITVDLFSFLLPPQSVDRSSFKMTLILGYTVFLLIMNDLLPITGNTIPIINIFFSMCLALMVASLLETILITNLLLSSKNVIPVPRWIRVFVLHFLGRVVRLPWEEVKDADTGSSSVSTQRGCDDNPHEEKEPAVEDRALKELRSLGGDLKVLRLQVEQQLGSTQSSKEWIQVGFIIDRLLFGIYLLFISVSFITIQIIWFKSNGQSSCGAIMSNCSRPDGPALLEALRPVFDLSSIRPVMNVSTTTLVNIAFVLIGILGVDEKGQILTTFIIQMLSWKNEFIGWDPNECGSHWITVPRKVLWVPDIVINEFMERNSAQFTPYTYVYHDGTVFDLQPVRVVSSCRLDIYTFPFDVQNCTLTFNAYLHSLPAIQIGRFMSAEEVFQYSKTMMTTMGEWELTGIKSIHQQLPSLFNGTYEELSFFISLRRRSMLYVVNLLIPSCFLITVDLFSFLLPPQKVDRSLFKMTLILGFTVFLLLMNDLLPITGNTIPLISVFLSLCLALMVVSLLETILITNLLHSSTHYSEVPRWIRLSVIHILGHLVLLPPKPTQVEQIIQNPATLEMNASTQSANEGEAHGPEGPLDEDKAVEELRSLGRDLRVIRLKVEQELNVSLSTEEWNQVGFIIDRLLFAIYILFLSVSFIGIIGMWVNSYNTS
ncbi:5-hydroxytryptamine receptor 3A-like [Hippocampus zosterae]|uniref:5-hydroxytryptamine receptor 3A-like n=1 Tax=Hippocampus zosterae TaxID=109293 RepID=UPI00223D8375|nr:5-hydroxytryptamine receptor 3A-like [Hippocampus zosterae]